MIKRSSGKLKTNILSLFVSRRALIVASYVCFFIHAPFANFFSLEDGSLEVVIMTLGSSTPAHRYSSSWLLTEATPPFSPPMASASCGPASSQALDLAKERASRRRSPSIKRFSEEKGRKKKNGTNSFFLSFLLLLNYLAPHSLICLFCLGFVFASLQPLCGTNILDVDGPVDEAEVEEQTHH